MKSILTLLKANIKHKKGAFKSVAALMAIITMSFAVTLSNNDNILLALNNAHTAADTGDLVVIISDEDIPENMYEVLDSSPDVQRYHSDECIGVSLPFLVDGNEVSNLLTIIPYSKAYLKVFNDSFDGFFEADEKPEPGEIYVPYSFSVIGSAKLGSEMKLRSGSGEYDVSFKIKGFTEEPFSGPAVMGLKTVVISDEDYNWLYSEKLNNSLDPVPFFTAGHMVHIFGKGELSHTELKKRLNSDCGIADSALIVMSREQSMTFSTIFTDSGTNILYVFVALLLAVVLIMMMNSINSSVETEYENLGILKSQGFTCGQIRLVFVLQYLIAEVIGAVLGMVVSVPLTLVLGKVFVPITGILTINRVSVLKCSLICLGIIMICSAFVVFATAKIGKISPVRAISGGKSEVYFDSRLNVRVRKKPLMFFLALRQITSRLKDYIGAAAITSLLVFFMVSVVVLTNGLSTDALFAGGCDVSANLNRNYEDSDLPAIREAAKEADEGAACCTYSYQYMMIDGVELACYITDDPAQLEKTYSGRLPKYDNEIAITEIAAEEIGKSVGDTVQISSKNGEQEFIITGFYQTPSELGRIFLMTDDGGRRTGLEQPAMLRFVLDDEANSERLTELLNERFGEILEASVAEKNAGLENATGLVDVLLNTIVGSVFGVSLIFAAVIVGMLCTKAFIRERSDIGIFKASGFTSGVLRVQFSVRFLLVAVVGSAAGSVLSLFLTKPLLSAMMRIVGLTNFLTDFTPMTFIPTIVTICGGCFVFAYFSSVSIRRVEVRELITE